MLATLILFLVISLLPIFVYEFRNNTRLLVAYWFVIALHQAVAFTNAFLFGTLGATGDGNSFHQKGTNVIESEFLYTTGADLYIELLGVIYWLFGSSRLLGAQFSILAFAVSCIVLIKILRLLELSHYRVSVLLFFGALPSMVFFGSVTLRESYQVLFFMLAVYFGIKMYTARGVGIPYIFMLLSAFFMGVLHYGLIIYSVFLVGLFLMWTPYLSSSWQNLKIRRLIIVSATLVLLSSTSLFLNVDLIQFEVLNQLREKSPLDVIWEKRQYWVTEAQATSRATYIIATDFSSPFTTVYTLLMIYMHYLFAPFPWQIKNILDVYASMESILRMVLIYYSVKHWLTTYGVQRRMLGLMILLFLSISFMFSVGTSNYGTAARHNLLSWWILSITGTPLLMKMLSRFRLA